MKRKICVITGARADYGLLYWLMKEIEAAADLELQVIVTGMHLSPEFGLTWRGIEQDGFAISRRVEMLMSSDTPVGIAKSTGLGMIGFADAYADLQPDLAVILGDRFETFAAAAAALVARIPIAHLHGGETTEGAFDEAMRHSITKMAHLHFTSTEVYRRRVIQLGEDPRRVFNVGAPGLDNIARLNLLSREMLEESLGFHLGERNLLVTFHPTTLEQATAARQFEELLAALEGRRDTTLIFTKPNADTDGRIICAMIDDFVAARPQQCKAFTSLGQVRYLSALRLVDATIGNSSSGLIEAPSLGVGTINIGDRQKGRIKAESVIDCAPRREAIAAALDRLYSPEFRAILPGVQNPYGSAGASRKIVEVLSHYPLGGILKKRFHDVEGLLEP